MSQNPNFDRLLKESIPQVRSQHRSSVLSWMSAKWKSKRKRDKATELLSQLDQPLVGFGVGLAGAITGSATLGWTGFGLAVPATILLVIGTISFARRTKRHHREKNKIRDVLAHNAKVNGFYLGEGQARSVQASIRQQVRGQIKDDQSVLNWMSYLVQAGFQDYQNAERKYAEAARDFEKARKEFDAVEKVQPYRLIGFEVGDKYFRLLYAYTYLVYRWERFVAYQYLVRITTERYNEIIRRAVHKLDKSMDDHVTDNRLNLSRYS
jgi:hypothetical protein